MKKEQFIICQNRGQFFLEKWKFHQKRNRKKNHSYLFKEWKKSGQWHVDATCGSHQTANTKAPLAIAASVAFMSELSIMTGMFFAHRI